MDLHLLCAGARHSTSDNPHFFNVPGRTAEVIEAALQEKQRQHHGANFFENTFSFALDSSRITGSF
jgi:hypothetical protein